MGIANKIAQHFLWRGLYLGSVFLVNLLLARIMEADKSGAFYLALNNLSLLVLVLSVSMESSLVYHCASNQLPLNKAWSLTVLWSVAVFILSLLFFWIGFNKTSYDSIEWLLLAFPSAFIIINNISALYQVKRDFRTYNIILTVVNIAVISYLIDYGNFFYTEESAESAAIHRIVAQPYIVKIYLFSVLIQAVVLLIFYWWDMANRKFQLPGRAQLARLMRYALAAWGANLVFFLVYRVDYWLVDHFRSNDELGNYIQVSKIVQLFVMIPALMASVLFPFTVGSDPDLMKANVARACRLLFSIFLILLMLLAATGKLLFPFLYGESFAGMYWPFVILIPGVLAISLQSLLAAWFAGMNQVKHNVYGALITLCVIVGLDFLLIPFYGIAGAAAASSVAYICYFIYQLIIFKKQSAVSLRSMLVVSKLDVDWAVQLITQKKSL